MIKEKQKEVYTSPETEVLVVKSEGVLCGSPDYGDTGAAGGDTGDAFYGNF